MKTFLLPHKRTGSGRQHHSERYVSGDGLVEGGLQGWLQKKGDKGAIKTWKERYFVQKGKKLFYYRSETAEQPQGFIGTYVQTRNKDIQAKENFSL